ncbi:MAG: VanZ family protein [Candidatus Udaeobacter sp.]
MKRFLKYWLLLLIWLGVIFVGSTDLLSAEQTSRFIVPILLWFKPGMAPETIWTILVIMRKCAHVCEYAILALLLWRALRGGSAIRGKMSILFGAALVVCAVFAVSDEFHQSFIKSRTPSFRDVLLDIAGALLGLLIGVSFAHRRPKKTRGTAESEFVDAAL